MTLLLLLLAALVPSAGPGSPWTSPLDPVVVSHRFRAPATDYGPGHRGVDLAGTDTQVVRASGVGRVSFAGTVATVGVVTVDHDNGLHTTYEPVLPGVRRGDVVGPGTPIGQLVRGHRGCGTLACLHWGLTRDGTYLDPLTLLRPGRARLVPLP
jgi:murein DD-endopeptidase MepM/ murein hydrolase activator NlpD